MRELRKAKGMTQEALAEKAKLHWTYVGGIERGEREPAFTAIGKLASALGVSLSELFRGI